MTWWTATNVAINNGQSIVNVTTGDDIQIAQEAGGLIIGNNPPVEIKRTFLDGTGAKKIELRLPWPYSNVTSQSAVAFPTDADLAEATRVLRAVGSDAVTFAEALAQVIGSTANTITVSTETSGDLSVVPYGKLTQQVQNLLNVIGDFGTPLLSSTSQNDARNKLGLAPRITAQPTLDLDFTKGEFKVYEQYGLTKKTISQAITTTRNSVATYNSPFGVATAAANTPRIEYDPATGEALGLLCEEARTNLVLWSENFTTSSWSKQNGSALSSTELSPIGVSANIFQANGTSIPWMEQTMAYTSGVFYVASIFVKAKEVSEVVFIFGGATFNNGGGTVSASFDLLTGQITSNTTTFARITPYPNGWCRISAGHTATASVTNGSAIQWVRFSGASTVAGNGVFVSGAQLEAGSFPTSYIKTEGSQVTRVGDNITKSLPELTNLNSWVLFLEANFFDGKNPSAAFSALGLGNFTLGFNSTSTVYFSYATNSNNLTLNTIGQSPSSNSVIIDTQNRNYKIAVCYTGSRIKTVVDGIIVNDRALSAPIVGINQLKYGSSWSTDALIRARILTKHLEILPRALSDQELIDLTRL